MSNYEKEAKLKIGLSGASTYFRYGLTVAGRLIPPFLPRWYSKDENDVRKLLSMKIPVQWTTQEGGIIEVGFNEEAQKFVGVHNFHKNILENPRFDSMEKCVEWFFKMIGKIEEEAI